MKTRESETIEIDLVHDFAVIAADMLEQYGFDRPVIDDARKVLLSFLGFQHRLIQQKPRKIYKPQNFTCPEEYREGLELLEQKITDGEDLTPHQSRQILKYEKKDPLLNDWGIQHLHLGTEMEPGRPLIQGTPEVLFVLFKNDAAYFIKIAGHGQWSDQDMIRILHDNFPESIESWRASGVLGLAHVPTNEDVNTLRKAGVNSGLEIYPGVVYFSPGGGYATDGTNIWVSMKVNDYARFSIRTANEIVDKEGAIRESLRAHTSDVPEILKIKLVLNDNNFVILETNTNVALLSIPTDSVR